jgi:hypothetical protein
MECKHARLLLEFARPRGTDLAADDAADLEGHLAECSECGTLACDERRLDHHLGHAMRAVTVPEGLPVRLLNRLAAERDRWWRQWLVRCGGLVAAAAALALLVWGGLIWRNSPRSLEVDEVVSRAADKSTASTEKVEEWFLREHGVHVAAPSDKDFDYRWLVDYRMDDLAGKRVPMLVFAYSGPLSQDVATLFIVTDKNFNNLHDLAARPPEGSGGFKVMVIQNRDRPGTYYVFIYKDGSEKRFLLQRNAVT